MKSFIRSFDWLDRILQNDDRGWGNGYVAIPKDSKLYKVDYSDLDVDVHGGLTFGKLASEVDFKPDDINDDDWIVGFDTNHLGDNKFNRCELFVRTETQSLLEQLKQLDKE